MKAVTKKNGLVLLGLAGLLAAGALGQTSLTEREVKNQPGSQDKGGIWALDFRFKDPRIIKVHVKGEGTRIYYYLWYQVINYTKEPRNFVPRFELVTKDYPENYEDKIKPTVQDAIKKIEDPTGYQDIMNSVEIATQPIPMSKPRDEAFPRAVTGVAIWEVTAADPAMRDPKVKDISDATHFSIFVSGLSNGYVIVDPLVVGLPPLTRHKTLQLNFKRKNERFTLDSRDISFVAPAEWIYRAGPPRDVLPLDKEDGKIEIKKVEK
jgi:hypothetical protein